MKTLRFLTLSILALGFVPVAADAQTVFQPQISERQVQQTLTRIRDDAEALRRAVDARFTYRERLEPEVVYIADDLVQAADHLSDHIARRLTVRADVEDVLRRGSELEAALAKTTRSTDVQNIQTRLRRNLEALATGYGITWDWRNPDYSPIDTAGPLYQRLTGTYQLDADRSDDPQRVADQVLRQVPTADRARIQRQIYNRLDPPEVIALERVGNKVTMASSKGQQTTFETTGRPQTETGPGGRTWTTRATSFGDGIEVTTTRAGSGSFSVTLEPLESGRSLRVTRRLFAENLRNPVVVQSIYRRTSETPDWTLPEDWRETPAGRGRFPSEFVVPDGTRLVATLDQNVNVSTARQDDRVTLTVRESDRPELRGAVIEGYVLSTPARSGERISFSVDFDQIRLSNGRTSRFVGDIEQVRGPNGETISFNGERVSDRSQRDRAVQRGALGAALGAIIGAVIGGGEGAVLGAVIGGGGAAATVFIEGQNNVLRSGTEFTIRAATPTPAR